MSCDRTVSVVTPHPWLEGCFEVTGTGDLERLSAFASGRCTVQDAAARLAAIAAATEARRPGAGCVRRPWRQVLRHGHARWRTGAISSPVTFTPTS